MANKHPVYNQPVYADDFAGRLGNIRPGSISADPGMVVQPPVDPGYAMPNAHVGNLNQTPGQAVGGWLPAAAQQPSAGFNSNMAMFANFIRQMMAQHYAQQQAAQPMPQQQAPR
jgi:hypothetical protein